MSEPSVTIRVGSFDWLRPEKKSLNLHVRWEDKYLNLDLPPRFEGEIKSLPWPKAATDAIELYMHSGAYFSLEPDITEFLAWISVDENHDAMYEAWERHKEQTRTPFEIESGLSPGSMRALLAAEHELTTLHGLLAADGAAPSETWTIDTSETLALISEALGRS